MLTRKIRCSFLSLFLTTMSVWTQGATDTPLVEPDLISVFPLGGRQGTSIEVMIRGKHLEDTYAVLFDSERLKGTVEKVEEIIEEPEEGKKEEKKEENQYGVFLQVEMEPTARVGNHALRLLSPRGISNPLQFRVSSDPVIVEIDTPHHTTNRAQQVTFPVVINGRISEAGKLDYYRFEVVQGEELKLELVPSQQAIANGFRAQLALYRVAESWFDPHRSIRLAFSARRTGEIVPRSTSSVQLRARTRTRVTLSYRFSEAGPYFVEVGSLDGKSSPDYIYQMRMVPAAQPPLRETGRLDWRERIFTRKLEADRLQTLRSRTVTMPKKLAAAENGVSSAPLRRRGLGGGVTDTDPPDLNTSLETIAEKEPNAELSEAVEIRVPSIIEGRVERPGDVDTFQFEVKPDQKLAFEIETPNRVPPYFNPWLRILDSKGREHLTNIHRKEEYKFNTIYLKWLEPKVIETFKKGGVYYLQIRDLTFRKGDPSFVYRVLIRPQIPHIGDIRVETRTLGLEDGRADPYRVNLVPGQAKKVTAILEQEEGFFKPSNHIAVRVANLPQGVEAFPGASSYQEPSGISEPKIHKEESYVPKSQKVTVVLHASSDAPLTKMPVFVSLSVRPFVEGKPGLPLFVGEIPVMLVRDSTKQ